MFDSQVALGSKVVTVSFRVNVVDHAKYSLIMLHEAEQFPGTAEWLNKAAAALSPERRATHDLVIGAFAPLLDCCDAAGPDGDFLAYLEWFKAQDPAEVQQHLLSGLVQYCEKMPDSVAPEDLPTPEQILSDRAQFVALWNRLQSLHHLDESLADQVYDLILNPAALLEMMAAHVKQMWIEVLEPEWHKSYALLQESVQAYSKLDFSGVSAIEAIKAVTGRDLSASWSDKIGEYDHLEFQPTNFLGPYVALLKRDKNPVVLFGVRLPKGYPTTVASFSRTELLNRLNALADDTRLQMLQLIAQEGEICAQDIITRLNITQSSASRHLRHLVATGYITERRRDVEKCYTLNSERLDETARALTSFTGLR